ncbi:concanavalin A-like lectin/glucanase domain-containing protein, partial [Lactarius quietus]
MRAGYAFLAALSLPLTVHACQGFYLQEEWIGKDFYEGWNWETENDYTDGRVNYVSMADAQSKNLTYVENDVFFMRADDVSIVSPSARGRDSIRLSSQVAYNESITVLDLQHMPAGCTTWPAFWTVSQAGPWPKGGEIDIVEGVNLNTHNEATLHTSSNCMMPAESLRQPMTGKLDHRLRRAVNGNEGCGVTFADTMLPSTSYGASFNQAGGGYFVMYRGSDAVMVWFFPRAGNVPDVILNGAEEGEPHFDAHNMVFDLTFCGDWAGNVFSTAGCGTGTCSDFVNNNPSAFAEAYW